MNNNNNNRSEWRVWGLPVRGVFPGSAQSAFIVVISAAQPLNI